jgi:adenosylcobyric acid synthase
LVQVQEEEPEKSKSCATKRNSFSLSTPSRLSMDNTVEMNEKLHPVMFAGTGSDVGKSVIAAAFCRIFQQDGYRPAPFKAQNMALNSYATPEGLEIGRAQAVQAEAAGIPCHTDMNPLLLKPASDRVAQVVLNGKSIGHQDAYHYFRNEGREALRKEVCEAFDRLAQRYNPVVMEGAGSISEINLRDTDLVNLPMAIHAGADVFLVADIDRGGVFAAVYGSILLLNETERKRVKGILINKFRGDLRLFEEGKKMLENLCRLPVLGIIPYYKDIYIEEEDSVGLPSKQTRAGQGKVNIAVVLLRHMSNFTDFDVLERDPRVHLFYTAHPEEILKADILLIPGTKNTLADLYELRRNGAAQAILQAHRKGTTVMGICGGYQLMGREVCDPHRIEGDVERLPGLGLLPVATWLEGEKITRQVAFRFRGCESLCQGYEIHMGRTAPVASAPPSPFAYLEPDNGAEGYYAGQTCFGTYLHGILDNAAFIDFLLEPFGAKTLEENWDYRQWKDEQYNKLADHVRNHVNLDLVYQILRSPEPC